MVATDILVGIGKQEKRIIGMESLIYLDRVVIYLHVPKTLYPTEYRFSFLFHCPSKSHVFLNVNLVVGCKLYKDPPTKVFILFLPPLFLISPCLLPTHQRLTVIFTKVMI